MRSLEALAVFDRVPKVEKTYRTGPPSPMSPPDEEEPTNAPESPSGAAASFGPAPEPGPSILRGVLGERSRHIAPSVADTVQLYK